MKITKDNVFDSFANDDKSFVFELFPDVHTDGRGSFSEVIKDYGEWDERKEYPIWFSNTDWIKQVNRSKSSENVVRGCHAQRGIYCQGKFVEAVNNVVFDVITDVRPDSLTFGITKVYRLDPVIQNKLWVPRGFLHSFVTTDALNGSEAIFMYYVDNKYNKESEITVNPETILPDVVDELKRLSEENKEMYNKFSELFKVFMVKEMINYSDKDKNGLDYSEFCSTIMSEYNKTGKVWYR